MSLLSMLLHSIVSQLALEDFDGQKYMPAALPVCLDETGSNSRPFDEQSDLQLTPAFNDVNHIPDSPGTVAPTTCGVGVKVNRATAVIFARPATVSCFEHSHDDLSQSQSQECPVYTRLTAMVPVDDDTVGDWGHVKKVQS
jgi:hypothetical protein